MRPSFVYHQIQVPFMILGFIILIILVGNGAIDAISYESGVLLLLFSISIGIHALIHFDEEVFYDFNPMIGKTNVLDDPIR